MDFHKDFKQLNMAGTYLVKLLSSVLHEKPAPALPSDLNWNLIFQFAKMHAVEVMAFYGAENFIKNDTQLYLIWKRCKDANLAQSLLQQEAREEIFTSLYESNIRFLPLKGFELKNLYKKPEYRQMSDIDILIDMENLSQVRMLMTDLGYDCLKEISSYEEYVKPPCIMIEIHKLMFSTDNHKYEYYKNIWNKCIPDEKVPGGYKLTPEDLYIFQIVHLWKHYNTFGSGIRPIMDIYLYLTDFRDKMNWHYIKKELQQLKLYGFSVKVESLSTLWFSDSEQKYRPSTEILRLQRNTFFSGIYGTKEAKMLIEMDNLQIEKGWGNKLNYIFKRLFVNRQELIYTYPSLKQHPLLLPFVWLHRFGNAVLHKKSSIKKEIELFQTKSKDN